jgi:hypothetical protein
MERPKKSQHIRGISPQMDWETYAKRLDIYVDYLHQKLKTIKK